VSGHPASASRWAPAGFGLEGFADITHGSSWHIGVLAAPGITDILFSGREREVLGQWAFPSMSVVHEAISQDDVDEFARAHFTVERSARSPNATLLRFN
jgi:hypothetical protein